MGGRTYRTYIEDVVSYGSIGARTVESPVHRQLAAAMKMPMGFKNGRSGARGLGRFLMWRSGSKISEKSSGNDFSDTLL